MKKNVSNTLSDAYTFRSIRSVSSNDELLMNGNDSDEGIIYNTGQHTNEVTSTLYINKSTDAHSDSISIRFNGTKETNRIGGKENGKRDNSSTFLFGRPTDNSNTIKLSGFAIINGSYGSVCEANPTINTAFNITSPRINDIINFTANITDGNGLLSANITYNISGSITYVNFSLSGTSAQVSNATKVCGIACVINFTMFATDISNNVAQKSELISVEDSTIPKILNYSIFPLSVVDGNKVNISVNASDDFKLKEINISVLSPNGVIINRSCENLNVPNYLCNITFFDGDETSVVGIWNLTSVYVVDTSGNVNVSHANITFEVTASPSPSPSPSGSSGGGGGCPPGLTADEVTGECKNATIIYSRNLSVIPSSNIDTFFIFSTFKRNNPEWRYLLKANKVLKECIITGNFKCQIMQSSDVLLTSLQKNPKYLSKVESGSIKIIDLDGQVSFRSIVLRQINLSYQLPFLHFKGSFIFVAISSIVLATIYRKKIIKFIDNLIKIKTIPFFQR